MNPTAKEEFERGLREHLPILVRVARRWLGEPARADDAVQEACMRAWRLRHRFRTGTNLKAWLLAILANVTKESRRRERRWRPLEEERAQTIAAPPEVDARDPLALERIREAFARLPVDQRVVLQLAEVEGLRYREIAEVLRVPIGTVMSRLSRARNALRGTVAALLAASEERV